MRQHDVLCAAIVTLAQPLSYVLIRQVTGARQDALLQLPRIDRAGLQHVAPVVRLDDDGGATAQTFFDQGCDAAEVPERRDLHAVMRGGEAEVVGGVVRDGERMKIYLADAKVLARRDFNDAVAQSISALARLIVAISPARANVSGARL